ncbi:stretch-activated Ca2+-permeable channel component-domain-containing protein [Lipomyces kononenkoae]|uniref:Stretch-activated Ca2+-permeable channel component-domain-containing protein n=1 Tax=Lipomyces kononenkoae TaxID=34357 RepID=A0ACC3T9X1_LIPKO
MCLLALTHDAKRDQNYIWPVPVVGAKDDIGLSVDYFGEDIAGLLGQVRFESTGLKVEEEYSQNLVEIRDIAPATVTPFSIGRGNVATFSFPNSGSQTVEWYISAAICTQPSSTQGSTPLDAYAADLSLRFVGRLQALDQSPADASIQDNDTLVNGVFYSHFSVEPSAIVSVDIIAPNYDDNSWDGSWTGQILATIYQFNGTGDTLNTTVVDTDASSVLLATGTLSNTTAAPPYGAYVYNDDNNSVRSLNGSYCAVTSGNFAAQASNTSIMTTLLGNTTREVIFAEGLNSASKYQAYVVEANSTLSGTGVVRDMVEFTTKTNSTCQVIYGLGFCDEIGYAVPSNTSLSRDDLASWYDDLAIGLYSGFNKSLQIVPCDVNTDVRYSIMRTCDQCRASYKRWLCLSLIPRCYESTTNLALADGTHDNSGLPEISGLAYRTPGTSRNSFLNDDLNPDDYTELMPCSYACHKVMQDCPFNLQFLCPLPAKGLYQSYGLLNATLHNGDTFNLDTATCNFISPVDAYSAGVSLLDGINVKLLLVGLLFALNFVVTS